jgi:hypothetical protein
MAHVGELPGFYSAGFATFAFYLLGLFQRRLCFAWRLVWLLQKKCRQTYFSLPVYPLWRVLVRMAGEDKRAISINTGFETGQANE